MNLFRHPTHLTFFILYMFVGFSICSLGCSAQRKTTDLKLKDSTVLSTCTSANGYFEQGLVSYHKGDFEQAVIDWLEALKLYDREGSYTCQSEALIRLSQAYQSIGQYQKALESIESALVIAEKAGNRNQIASARGFLGNVYNNMGQTDKAYTYFNEALHMSKELGRSGLSAVILNNLGNLYAFEEKYSDAIDAYMEAIRLAEQTGNKSLTALAMANAAMAYIKNGQYKKSKSVLDNAFDMTRNLTHSHDKAFGMINIGLGYFDLRQHLHDDRDPLLLLSFKSFSEAAIISEAIGDLRSLSYAWGYIGKTYEDEGRYQEALQSTRQASFSAQQANAPESIYQWQWQTGRLLKAMGKMEESIQAYTQAVDTLESIRQEMTAAYGNKKLSFRETVGPMYFELVDLLLQRAASMDKREEYEPLLLEAREKIELLKVAELQDYFRDECVIAAQSGIKSLEVVSKTAIVIYPILLPDRTELLVSLPGGMKRFLVPVGKDRLTIEIGKFRKLLEKRTSRQYLIHARKLYDWLIRPLEPDLTRLSVNTLVFVPDGFLRTIPMAALHDGKRFLVEKFALAITPGLNLTDPRSIDRENLKLLAVGITESLQGFPPLPHVAGEIRAIQGLYGGTVMLNRDFLISNLEKTLLEEPFNIIHIASHGQFESDVDKTFLLTFDEKLTLDRLDQCVGFLRFREKQLELLTLSACQTATGDERAALGLAGVAVKAGARSALATLWYINDEASSILVKEFYRQLHNPSTSRATALQHAQLKLLNDIRYEHPGYWSPFLLINNWL